MKSRNLILLFLIIISGFNIVFSHDGVDHDAGEEHASYYQSFSAALPFVYFAQGNYWTGILVIVLWIAILYGVYNLFLMSMARLIVEDKGNKRKRKK